MLSNVSKKRKTLIFVLFTFIFLDLLLLIIVSLPFTRAFFQSNATSSVDLDIAQFNFLVNNQLVPSDLTIDLEETLNEGYTKVIPGSSGVIDLSLDASNSDVKIKCLINFDRENSTNLPSNLKLYSDENYSNEITDTEIVLINYKEKVNKKIYWKWIFTDNTENDYMNTEISLKLSVTAEQRINDTLADAIINNAKKLGSTIEGRTTLGYPQTSQGKQGSDSNEKVLASTQDDDYGTSYYFRGNVQDNFVNFADMCWRIVRIQGDNSVKLILEDKDNTCQNANGGYNTTYEGAGSKGGSNAFIGITDYGYKLIDTSYRFDYKNNGKFANEKGAKQMIDDWINNTDNIPDSDKSKLKEENWCLGNQTDWYDYSTGKLSTSYSSGVYSETYKRLYGLGGTPKSVTLKCNGDHDEKVSDLGGLLTVDEVTLAGYYGTVYSSYLYIYNQNWWLATSAYRTYANDTAFFVYGSSIAHSAVNWTYTIRPAVVLKPEIEILDGDGTQGNPYNVSSMNVASGEIS